MFFFTKLNFVVVLMTLTFIQLNCAANSDKKQEDPKCLLPMEPGPCRMNLNRFYYNANTDTCEEFKFGGCKGNDNKFGFKQTCEAACKKSTAGTALKSATTTTSSSTTEATQTTTKQLKSDTITTPNTNGAKTSTTTSKPGTARTTMKTFTSTTKGGTATEQKLKQF